MRYLEDATGEILATWQEGVRATEAVWAGSTDLVNCKLAKALADNCIAKYSKKLETVGGKGKRICLEETIEYYTEVSKRAERGQNRKP